jgi:hypothetical protein
MRTFKQFLLEDSKKFKGTYNWHGEFILRDEYTTASNKDTAHRNFCATIAKKLKITFGVVSSYYKQNPNGYKIQEG